VLLFGLDLGKGVTLLGRHGRQRVLLSLLDDGKRGSLIAGNREGERKGKGCWWVGEFGEE
jgi:hypothetical protein